jgi:hypothetical protein
LVRKSAGYRHHHSWNLFYWESSLAAVFVMLKIEVSCRHK